MIKSPIKTAGKTLYPLNKTAAREILAGGQIADALLGAIDRNMSERYPAK